MSSISFVQLPNEVVTEILKYCIGQDILNLIEACYNNEKIRSVAMNKRLWRNAVIGPTDPKRCMKYLGTHTVSLTIVGSFIKSRKSMKVSKHSGSASTLTEALISTICLRQRFI